MNQLPIHYVYVDNSNVWIEGRRASAVAKGLASSFEQSFRHKILDQDWTYDFGRLYDLACPRGAPVGRSILVGSRPPANDSVWDRARDADFEVETFDRNAANREKQVDTRLATVLVADSYESMQSRVPNVIAVLVSGDGDYIPPIKDLQRRGIRVRVVFWDHATAGELKATADEFVGLDEHLDHLTR